MEAQTGTPQSEPSLSVLVEGYFAAKADFLAATRCEQTAASALTDALSEPSFRIRLRTDPHITSGPGVIQLSPSVDPGCVRDLINRHFDAAIAQAECGLALEATNPDTDDFVPIYRWGILPTPDALRSEREEVLRRAGPVLRRAEALFDASGYISAVRDEERTYRALMAAKEALLAYRPATLAETRTFAAAVLRDVREGDGLLMMHELDENEDVERVLRVLAGLD